MTTTIYPSLASAISHSVHTAVAPLTWNPVEHLLARTTFGATPGDRAYVGRYGPDAFYKLQVGRGANYSTYRGNRYVNALCPLLAMNPYDVRQWLIRNGNEYGWEAMDQLTNATLGLQTWSIAQLYEVLVDFFSNHLNVPNHNGDLWNTRHTHDRDVVRRFAMGSYTNMLLASAKNPAMLLYLNLAESNKTAINENYGRELLELHTVGLRYTENDVKNAARLLSGRTLDDNFRYVYDEYIHATGKVTVLGFTDANLRAEDGERAGDNMIRYLAAHPFTATRLAQKLCTRLVSDTPSAGLVNAVAHAYLANRTQILPMVSTILRSAEFWQSRGRKVRRPAENVVATVRTTGVGVSNLPDALDTLHWVTAQMGNTPLEWPTPDGYPDVASAWRSAGTLLRTWEMHLGIAGGWWNGLRAANIAALYGGVPANSGDAIVRLGRTLTGTTLSSTHRSVLQTFLGEPARTPMSRSILQWWDSLLAATILDGPHHALR
ncbi:MAG TPA: DUF1800 domain-containing protein [Jatrophihabitans sp.]|jgi:hypothetical protein|uniref:DUF1800 domain-containing protein n=1 Tax=Jatrophihabitans sp. TaxID=1932789 RepID=UPI002DF9E793|nr:DUF1800 domain-containing protein [Jatrophihabitans sp.]